ncbi:MAG: hypothetical protein ABF904_09275, partial [Ethanoligenens sp.]
PAQQGSLLPNHQSQVVPDQNMASFLLSNSINKYMLDFTLSTTYFTSVHRKNQTVSGSLVMYA